MDAKLKTQNLELNQIIAVGMARYNHYVWVIGITIFADIALLAMTLSFGQGLTTTSKLALAVLAIAATAYGALGGRSALESVKAIADDFVEQSTNTHYSRFLAKQPMALFTALTVGLVALIGLALLAVIWAA